MVEEVAAAAGSLQDLAETLVASTRAFTLKDRARGFAAAPAASRPAPGRANAPRKAATAARPTAASPQSKARAVVADAAADDWQTF